MPAVEFYNYVDVYRRRVQRRSLITSDQFYGLKLESLARSMYARDEMLKMAASTSRVHYGWEYEWCRTGRPYYNLYPGIIEMLLRINLAKVKVSDLRSPNGLKALIVNLPKGNKLMHDGSDMYHLFINIGLMTAEKDGCTEDVVGFGSNYGEEDGQGLPIWDITFSTKNSVRSDGETTLDDLCTMIEEKELSKLTDWAGAKIEHEMTIKLTKIAAAICLIEADSELLVPELLSKHVGKLKDQHLNLTDLQQKAKQRGKFGWSLGKDVDRLPHERRPHPAIYWTGPGSKKPVVLIRAGSLVNRKVAEVVPTGYHDEDVPE